MTDAASASMFSLMSCWSLKKTRERVGTGVSFQEVNASLEEATAALNSSGVHIGSLETTSWVAGLCTSIHCLVLESTNLPSIRSLTVGCGGEDRGSGVSDHMVGGRNWGLVLRV